MLARTTTYVLDGIEAQQLTVEVDVRQGLPTFTILGQGDNATRVIRENVTSAIRASGFEFPQRRVTINVAPASFRGNLLAAPGIDLAIALAVLAATDQGGLYPDTLAGQASYASLQADGQL